MVDTDEIDVKNVKVIKMGNSFGIIIPVAFIKSGIVKINKDYDLFLKSSIEVENASI